MCDIPMIVIVVDVDVVVVVDIGVVIGDYGVLVCCQCCDC